MADSTSEEWKTFLKAVDSLSAANEDVETAAVFLTSLKPIRTADHLEGQDASDLLAGSGAPHNFGPKGLLRRAVRAADAAGAAKRRRTATPPDAGSASAAQNPGGSAQTLAQAIAPTGPKVNVQKLQTDTNAAAAADPVRKPFTYIDLTKDECLPIWMNPEDIGGKVFGTANDWFGGADPDTNQLTQLASALKAAASSTRRFHRMSQWCPTFRKFAIAAVGTGQWTMGQAWMHEETVLKLAETERVLSNQPMTAAVYEDMARKAWHQRAERGDPLWILEDEVKKVNEGILATARARIRVVLQPNSGPRG